MIIPLIIPENGWLLNLAHVARVHQDSIGVEGKEDAIWLFMADGESRLYTGDSATRINAELVFARNTYANFQAGIHAAAQQAAGSQIIIPDITGKGRIN